MRVSRERVKSCMSCCSSSSRPNSEPLASFILQTPKHKIKAIPNGYNEQSAQPMKQKSLWKSSRLQQKAFEGKSLMKKAQELIAKSVVSWKRSRVWIT
jgi:hypothetical protein